MVFDSSKENYKKMILVIETKTLYRTYIKDENADESILKEISFTEFATWKELTDTMNADRKSFPNSFYLKEVK